MSYIDEDNSVQERQRELYSTYGFHCECAKCKTDAASVFLDLIYAQKCHPQDLVSKMHPDLASIYRCLRQESEDSTDFVQFCEKLCDGSSWAVKKGRLDRFRHPTNFAP